MSIVFFLLLGCGSKTEEFSWKGNSSMPPEPDAQEPSTEPEPSSEPSAAPDTNPPEEPAADPDDQSAEPAGEPDTDQTDSGQTDTGQPDTGGTPITQKIRFVVLGDGGMGNPTQYAVSAAVETVCLAKADAKPGCEFALYLGDNIYNTGAEHATDPQFQTKFEDPYANLSFPFYITLGNHDYGDCIYGNCAAGYDFDRPDAQVAYTSLSAKWNLPSRTYEFMHGQVHFFSLDTNAIMWSQWFSTMDGQDTWLDSSASASTSTWKIAFGHHPYVSNGHHGNAGSYDGINWSSGTASDALVGTEIQTFMEDHVCGVVDIYFSGHDHNRQWLEPVCGTEFIVSGAASKLSPLVGSNASLFEEGQKAGFLWVEIEDSCFRGEFYDAQAQLDFSHQVCK